MLRFPLFGHIHFNRGSDPFQSTIASEQRHFLVAQLSFFQTLYGKAPLPNEKHFF